MVPAARVLIVLGQDDAVAADLVDGADMRAVRTDHFHMLGDAAHMLALGLALLPPAAELLLELRLMLAAIFVIVAVELVDPLLAPLAVMPVVQVASARRTFEAAFIAGAITVARPIVGRSADRRRDRMRRVRAGAADVDPVEPLAVVGAAEAAGAGRIAAGIVAPAVGRGTAGGAVAAGRVGIGGEAAAAFPAALVAEPAGVVIAAIAVIAAAGGALALPAALVGLAPARRVVVAEPGPDFIAGAVEETAIVVVAAAGFEPAVIPLAARSALTPSVVAGAVVIAAICHGKLSFRGYRRAAGVAARLFQETTTKAFRSGH